MIDIVTKKGEMYSFNPETERIFKNGIIIPSSRAEPVYSDVKDENRPPQFAGIFFRDSNSILTLSGNLNPITDINNIY